ncbi:unnamed protein product [Anisakis simplex]|uniref:ZP domain-containing protein n=1 Tax=Anisakis simplex TaxID=6269 RepID=A0A0M3J1Z5_ANISI|nr:unnamed protein product [Anisakis simplex]
MHTASTNISSPATSPSPTPTLTHASTAASTTPPAAASTTLPAAASTTPPTEASGVSETVVNSTKELKYGTPVEISVNVHPGSSYSFNITNEEDHKPTGEIQVKVTMCNASKEAAKPVEPSGNGLYEIPATKLHDLIIYFNCSHKSRVKRSTGNREYKMNLFITGTSKTDSTKNISVVGISRDMDVRGTTPTHTTATQSGSTSSFTTHATTAHTTPATSLSTGWIIGIVFIALFGVTLIVAISVFAYFYLKKRRGSINDDREGLFKRQQFVDEVPPRILPLPKTFGHYQTPQTSSMIPAINNYSSSRPSYYPQTSSTNPPTNNQFGSQLSNYPQPSSNYPKLIRPNIQSLQPNIASSINPATPNNNLYGPRGLSRNY